MKVIENLKTFFWEMRMRDVAKKQQRKRSMMGLDQAKYIGIYFPYTEANMEFVKNFIGFLEGRGIKSMVLSYIDTKEKPEHLNETPEFGFYTKGKLGFNRVPNDDISKLFIKQKFDILIDLSLDNHFQNLYISNASRAQFKIGRLSDWGLKVYDFTIEVPKATDLEGLLKAILKYLDIFNQEVPSIDFNK